MALVQDSWSDMMTKPKPLERCVARSTQIVASETWPNLGVEGGENEDEDGDEIMIEIMIGWVYLCKRIQRREMR